MQIHRRSSPFVAAAVVGLMASGASAVTFHVGSGSIDGSLCVGNDCVSSESFGFDTLRLKENNLRLHFDDTSTAASFPPNDWRLYANDSANGGSSYFGIEDATAGRFVFRVFAGARANAMTIDSQGDLGLGTTTPATDIDIKIGDTPTVRLQQDGSSGFAPQTWDMAGNETSFFIRDATNGSTLPFRIRPTAPSQSLVIDTDGDVGVGILTATAALHVVRSTNAALDALKITNNGGSFITMENTDAGAGSWFFTHENNAPNRLLVNHSDGGLQLVLDRNGNMELSGDLTTTGAVCGSGCDRVFDADYPLPTIPEQAAMMFENRHLPNVGPTPEDGPFNVTQKVAGMLNELEKAHIYIAELESRLATREAQDAQTAELLAGLQSRLDRLETGRD